MSPIIEAAKMLSKLKFSFWRTTCRHGEEVKGSQNEEREREKTRQSYCNGEQSETVYSPVGYLEYSIQL